jgi:hypothetical protein
VRGLIDENIEHWADASTSNCFGNNSLKKRAQTPCVLGISREPALANKPDYVDLIGAATRQHWRRAGPRGGRETKAPEKQRLSNWPPAYFEKWRMENLTPWRLSLKSWKFKDWD